MSASNQQIITLYETEEMSPEEIARELDYDLPSVKAILATSSQVYRQKNKSGELSPNEDISDDEKDALLARMKSLALYSDDEHVASRMCRYLFDEKKGRNNITTIGQGLKGMNVLVINNTIAAANEAVKRALQRPSQSPVRMLELAESNNGNG